MTLCDELYFEITLTGTRDNLNKFVSFLRADGLDEYIEFSSEFISYDDLYDDVSPSEDTYITFSNDDFGIEIEEVDADEFAELFCRAAKELSVSGRLFDIDNEEFCFESDKGDDGYINLRKIGRFNEDDDLRDNED